MEQTGKNTHPKEKKAYSCIPCQFFCYNKKDYNRHLITKKHKNMTVEKICELDNNSQKICNICNKKYKTDSGLWKHQQKCKTMKVVKDETDYKKLIIDVVDKNNELQKMLKDQHEQHTKNLEDLLPKLGHVTNNTTNHTINEVNINLFLNEFCKDALNISDFVRSLQIKFDNLENTCKVGHINNISQIFIDGLKDLDMYQRPLHCSDFHKKTLYVKDNNIWEKDDKKLRQAIVVLNEKNIHNISTIINDSKQYNDDESYTKIISDGLNNDSDVNKDMEKIIKNVAKEVIIN